MITLLTGLPGNGKGVYGLDYWKHKAERENRPVYYSGVNDCRIPNWIQLDNPEEWWKCPAGSMILIDECQRIFRTRANGSQVPKHVSELETHRHYGLDLLLITQHPMLIDQNIRRLVEQHFHIVRKFGMQKAVVHEWRACVEQPQKTRKDSVRHDYSYNKQVFTWYKSAEVHTVKRNIPFRYILMFLIPIIVLGLAYVSYKLLDPTKKAQHINETQKNQLLSTVHTISQVEHGTPIIDYYQSRSPRVAGLPQTAPVYDEITKPTTAPRPAACVDIRGKCTCYSQQATKLDTPEAMCLEIIEKGYFVDYEEKQTPSHTEQIAQVENQTKPTESSGALAPERGLTVAAGSVELPPSAELRSPSKAELESMRHSPWAYKDPYNHTGERL